MPRRIQRRRTKGWRMPEGAVCVTRETWFGNPFRVGDPNPGDFLGRPFTQESAVAAFRDWMEKGTYPTGWTGTLPVTPRSARLELRGKDLVCWCPLDQPCHADVLLEIANAEVAR